VTLLVPLSSHTIKNEDNVIWTPMSSPKEYWRHSPNLIPVHLRNPQIGSYEVWSWGRLQNAYRTRSRTVTNPWRGLEK